MANSKLKCPNCGERNRRDDDDVVLVDFGIKRLFCNESCRYEYNVKSIPKALAKAKKARKKKELDEKRSDTKYWDAKLQKECNRYIRLRDRDLPCISCGTTNTVQWEAGHYRSVGGNPEIRFHAWNINTQCHRCNCEGSANYRGGKGWGWGYDKGVIERFGQDRLDWLQGYHEPRHYTADDKQRLMKWYKYRNKQLNKISKGEV